MKLLHAFFVFTSLAYGSTSSAKLGYNTIADLDGQIIIPDQHKNGNRVIILPTNRHNWNSSDILWEWKVSVKDWGKHMSDARRVSYNGTDHILLCGSSGGIALVEVNSKKLVYWNTPDITSHALALLPDDLIAVADPADDGGTAAVKIFDMQKGNNKPEVQSLQHAGVHGVVWDANNWCLWGWGGSLLTQYSYNNKTRQLAQIKKYRTPSSWNAGGGHALSPMGSSKLLFSYNGGLGVFDTKSKDFQKYDTTVGHSTKGVSYNNDTGEVIYCHADSSVGDSRSNIVHSTKNADRKLPGGEWYRARFYFYNHL